MRADQDAGPDAGVLLGARVASFLRHHIAEHGLRPDDPLPGETEISRTLGISRPVVREAARGLAALGVITVAPGRRARVARVRGEPVRSVFEHALSTGQATVDQMLELRQGIEASMAAHAARRRTGCQAAELELTVARMGALLPDPPAYAGLDLRFHLLIADAAANPFFPLLIEASQAAVVGTMLAGLRGRSGPAELARVQQLHVAVAQAILRQDGDAARAAMNHHFDDARAALARMSASATEEGIP